MTDDVEFIEEYSSYPSSTAEPNVQRRRKRRKRQTDNSEPIYLDDDIPQTSQVSDVEFLFETTELDDSESILLYSSDSENSSFSGSLVQSETDQTEENVVTDFAYDFMMVNNIMRMFQNNYGPQFSHFVSRFPPRFHPAITEFVGTNENAAALESDYLEMITRRLGSVKQDRWRRRSKEVIRSIKKFKYKELKVEGVEIIEDKSTEESCLICLDKYKNKDFVKRLRCDHLWHAKCIDTWLKDNSTCPFCKCEVEGELDLTTS
eukprot:snap_masked-scaffold_44-processed-gene-1.11-mRNA-1 protein AED:0.83 eAED:0.83 QI:0/-1/0/1/-1/1/1/0/261